MVVAGDMDVEAHVCAELDQQILNLGVDRARTVCWF
jgi:hypothetical protein